MSSTGNDDNLTRLEIQQLSKLEAVVGLGLGTSIEVCDSLAGIRDRRLYRRTHESFERYLRDRWAISDSHGRVLTSGIGGSSGAGEISRADPAVETETCERSCPRRVRAAALATAWDQVLQHFEAGHVAAFEVRVTAAQGTKAATAAPRPASRPSAELPPGELLGQLRSLLTQSGGKIAAVAHHIETRAADLGEVAREQLREDLDVLDDDVATLKALLAPPIDWDAEYGRLLADEIPPAEDDDEA